MFSAIALLPVLLFVGVLHAPTVRAEPAVSTELSASRISSRETVTLTVQIEWPLSDGDYQFALPTLRLVNLEVLQQGEAQETFRQAEVEWSRKMFTFVLKPLHTGEAVVEAFALPYRDPRRLSGGELSVPLVRLTIVKALFIPWPFLVAGLFGLLAAGGIGLLVARKRRARAIAAEPMPTAEDIAVDQIRRCVVKGANNGKKEILSEVGRVFKLYLADHYQLGSRHPTESELIRHLEKKGLSREELQALKSLIARLHEAKFAGLSLGAEEVSRLSHEIIRYVEGKKVAGPSGATPRREFK